MQKGEQSQENLFHILKIAPFRHLWLAQLISQIAWNMLVFVLGVVIYESTHANTKVSLLYLTVGVPAIIFGILSGVIVDKYNKRKVLIYSTLIRFLLILFIIIFHKNIWIVYFCVALISIASQFFVPAEASLIPKFVKTNQLLSANSLFTITFYSAIIGGFVAGGPFLRIFGDNFILWFIACLFLLTILFLVLLPHKNEEQKNITNNISFLNVKNDLTNVFQFIKTTPNVQQAILLMTMAQAIISIFLTLGPGFADKIMHIKVADASVVILGPAAIGMILGAFLIGTLGFHFRKRKMIHFGIMLSGIILILLSLIVRTKRYDSIADILQEFFSITWETGIFLITLLCFFILGFANSLIDISCNAVLQENTNDSNRGKIYGILSSLISGVSLFPVIITGVLADYLGIDKIIITLGVLLTGFSLFAGKITNYVVHDKSN
jgi:MFS transporter, DHA3 family, macrolide efflux protein